MEVSGIKYPIERRRQHRLQNLPEATKPVSSRIKIQVQLFWLQ